MKRVFPLILIGLIGLAASCGSSSSGTSYKPTSDTFLPRLYLAFLSNQTLKFVNSSSPNDTIDEGQVSDVAFVRTFNLNNQQIQELCPRYAVYIKGGKIYSFDTLSGFNRQVSSLSNASEIVKNLKDEVNGQEPVIAVRLQDNFTAVVPLFLNSTQPVFGIGKYKVAALFKNNSVLIEENGTLKVCPLLYNGVDLLNCKDIKKIGHLELAIKDAANENVLLKVSNTTANDTLDIYYPSSQKVRCIFHNGTLPIKQVLFKGGNVFFTLGNSDVYQVNASKGNFTAVAIFAPNAGRVYNLVVSSNGDLAFAYNNTLNTYACLKAVGAKTVVVVDSSSYPITFIKSKLAYQNFEKNTFNLFDIYSTVKTTFNGTFCGGIWKTTFSLSNSSDGRLMAYFAVYNQTDHKVSFLNSTNFAKFWTLDMPNSTKTIFFNSFGDKLLAQDLFNGTVFSDIALINLSQRRAYQLTYMDLYQDVPVPEFAR